MFRSPSHSLPLNRSAYYFIVGLALPIFLSLLHLNIKMLFFRAQEDVHLIAQEDLSPAAGRPASSAHALEAALLALERTQRALSEQQRQAVVASHSLAWDLKGAMQAVDSRLLIPGLQLFLEADGANTATPGWRKVGQQHAASSHWRALLSSQEDTEDGDEDADNKAEPGGDGEGSSAARSLGRGRGVKRGVEDALVVDGTVEGADEVAAGQMDPKQADSLARGRLDAIHKALQEVLGEAHGNSLAQAGGQAGEMGKSSGIGSTSAHNSRGDGGRAGKRGPGLASKLKVTQTSSSSSSKQEQQGSTSSLVSLMERRKIFIEQQRTPMQWLMGQQSAPTQARVDTLEEGVKKFLRRTKLKGNITRCIQRVLDLKRLTGALCNGESSPWCRDAPWLRFSPSRCTEGSAPAPHKDGQPLGTQGAGVPSGAGPGAEVSQGASGPGSHWSMGGALGLRPEWALRHEQLLTWACSEMRGFQSECSPHWPLQSMARKPGTARSEAGFVDCGLEGMCRQREKEGGLQSGPRRGAQGAHCSAGTLGAKEPQCQMGTPWVQVYYQGAQSGEGTGPGGGQGAGKASSSNVGKHERESSLSTPSVLWRTQRAGQWADDGTGFLLAEQGPWDPQHRMRKRARAQGQGKGGSRRGQASRAGRGRPSTIPEKVDTVSVLLQYFKHPDEISSILGHYFNCTKPEADPGSGPPSADRVADRSLRLELLAFIDETSGWKQWRDMWNRTRGQYFFRGVFTHNFHESRGYNRLAAASRGSMLVLIQDDDVPPKNCRWLKRGLSVFETRPLLALAGFRHGLWMWRDTGWKAVPSTPQWRARGPREWFPALEPETGLRAYFPSVLDVGPLAVRRTAWQSIGGLDEGLSRWGETHSGYADYDLAYRMWLSGWEVMHIGGDKDSVMKGASTPGETHKFSASSAFRSINLHLNRKWVQRLVTWIGPRLERELRRKNRVLKYRDPWVREECSLNNCSHA